MYYCWFPTIEQAIAEEKSIKGGSRLKKIELVKGMNPDLKNLEVTLQIWKNVLRWEEFVLQPATLFKKQNIKNECLH